MAMSEFHHIMTRKIGDLCPHCKKKRLIRSDHIRVDGYAAPIKGCFIKCPDETDCGFAHTYISLAPRPEDTP